MVESVPEIGEGWTIYLYRPMNTLLFPVRDEVENVRSYVSIQLLMHKNAFDEAYESTPGRGTTAVLKLPADTAER